MAEAQSASLRLPVLGRPIGIPDSFLDHARLMFDLQVIAFQADLTGVTSIMLGREGSNLLILLAGPASGQIKGGRHLRYPKETPMTNLLLTVLDRVGVPEERIGDSCGKLPHLTDV